MLTSKAGLGAIAAAAIMLASPTAGLAASAGKSSPQVHVSQAGPSDMTEFSAQRRRYARRGGRGIGPGGALVGAAAVGIIGSAIAAGAVNDYYYGRPYYGPGYYGGPGYYAGPGYYSRW